VKNLNLFNQALLSEWKWRMLNERNVNWYNLLNFRYGSFPNTILCREEGLTGKKDSLWWRDICTIGGRNVNGVGWFSSNV
jgi:hypothetical protein